MADKKCTTAWVKACAGIEGNEIADKAARQGAENKDSALKLVKKILLRLQQPKKL